MKGLLAELVAEFFSMVIIAVVMSAIVGLIGGISKLLLWFVEELV